MDSGRPVIVIGAAGVDIKGRPFDTLQMGTSNRGDIRSGAGGVARNIAENLARLEISTILLSAVGQDEAGDLLLAHTREAGVDISHVLRLPDAQTGSYLAIMDQTGQLFLSVSMYDIIDSISPDYIQAQKELLSTAAMIVVDANLPDKSLKTLFRIAKRAQVPVCADPTSQLLAAKLVPYLPDLYMIAPDAGEAAVLCGMPDAPADGENAIRLAQRLVGLGAKIGIVTMAEHGAAYADGSSAGHLPALRTQIVDPTGAGDALTAAVICGLLNEMPLDEAMRLGISAAALTLRTRETVVIDLSLDRLYDDLIV